MHRDIVVMGASAGGVEALCDVVAGLPTDLDAAVFVVLHMPATGTSVLPAVLQRCTLLPTTAAIDGETIENGHIYIAPPDHHVLVRDGGIRLSRGPKENGHRPAVDTLFRSAARAYGPRVIGVVLSGSLDDGAMGLRVIAGEGGVGVVQDPQDAPFPGMPVHALEAVPRAMVGPAKDLGRIIGEISRSPLDMEESAMMADDTSFVKVDPVPHASHTANENTPSVFTCPECHGTLFLVEEDNFERFRCRVGHGFSADSLLASQSDALEAALWAGLRALEERNDLTHRMADRARRMGQLQAAARFDERERDGNRNIKLLRQVLLSGETAQDAVV